MCLCSSAICAAGLNGQPPALISFAGARTFECAAPTTTQWRRGCTRPCRYRWTAVPVLLRLCCCACAAAGRLCCPHVATRVQVRCARTMTGAAACLHCMRAASTPRRCGQPWLQCGFSQTPTASFHSAPLQACLTADEDFPAFILNTFRGRYKVRLALYCPANRAAHRLPPNSARLLVWSMSTCSHCIISGSHCISC